jgi:hypothetical protein
LEWRAATVVIDRRFTEVDINTLHGFFLGSGTPLWIAGSVLALVALGFTGASSPAPSGPKESSSPASPISRG